MGCTSSVAEGPAAVPVPLAPKVPSGGFAKVPSRHAGFRTPAALPWHCLGGKLGAGAYATVHAVTKSEGLFENCPVEPLAAKVIEFSAGKESPNVGYEKALREANVWQLVCRDRNEFVVSLVETFLDEQCAVFVMERCHTTLALHMDRCPRLDEAVVAGLLTQMLRGLQHIHGCDVIHRDVKPDNVLVGHDETLKISDFGLAVTSDNIWEKGNEPHPIRNPDPAPMVAGTAPFMSPEMLSKVAYSTQTDIWSLGCVAYVMLLGQFPYMPKEMSTKAMKSAIRDGCPKPSFQPGSDTMFPKAPLGSYRGPSDLAGAFLVRTLDRDAATRPTALEALQSPYLNRELSAEDSIQLPCLRHMLKRAMICGAFENVKPKPSAAKPLDASAVGKRSSRKTPSEQRTDSSLKNPGRP